MLFEELLIVVGIPLILVLVGFIAHRAELTFIGGIGLLVAGVLVLASPLVVEYNLNSTSEMSHVWNCSNYTDDSCLGTPWKGSCWPYNETQCRDIDGCEWSIQGGCYGTPEWDCDELFAYGGEEKCQETYGCYIWNLTNPHECDNYETTYTYEGVEIEEDNNLILGVLLAFFGLLALAVGALTLR